METRHLIAMICVFSSYVGLSLNQNQQEAVAAVGSWIAGKLGWEWGRESPKNFTFKDVGDHGAQFKFSDKNYTLYGVLANVTNFNEAQRCKKYEEMTRQDMLDIIENIGNTSNLDSAKVREMKIASGGARAFEAIEKFEAGINGRFLLLKYTVSKTPSGNYDFIIAWHGMSWALDEVSDEERERLLDEKLGNIKGVLVEDLPEVARTDIKNWLNFQKNPSRTLQEIDNELENLRARSEKSLSKFCNLEMLTRSEGSNSAGP